MRIIEKVAICLGAAGLLFAATSMEAQTVTLLSADYGVEGSRQDVTCRVQSMVQNGYLHFQITNYQLGGDPAPEQPKEFRIRARDYQGRIYDFRFPEKTDVDLQVMDHGPNCPNAGVNGQWQGRLTDDNQQRFDSFYTQWLMYRQQNNQAAIVAMQNRMYEIYRHYGLDATVPFNQVASPNAVTVGGGYSDLQVISAVYGIPGHTVDVTNRLRSMIRNGNLGLEVNNDSMGNEPAPGKHKVLTLTYSCRGQQRTLTVREGDNVSLP